jgi:predicted adenylyl cyclase CyaB
VRERVNLEVKAYDPDPASTSAACARLGAEEAGVLHQRDTYFGVRSARLKLREHLEDGSAELVYYERPSTMGVRSSRYVRVPVVATEEVRALLSSALGVRGVVEKERRLFLHENVRIHLDDVDELGRFVELEGVLSSPDGPTAAEDAVFFRVGQELLGDDPETVAGSYIDLLASGGAATQTVGG